MTEYNEIYKNLEKQVGKFAPQKSLANNHSQKKVAPSNLQTKPSSSARDPSNEQGILLKLKPYWTYLSIPFIVLIFLITFKPSFILYKIESEDGTEILKVSYKKLLYSILIISGIILGGIFGYRMKYLTSEQSSL